MDRFLFAHLPTLNCKESMFHLACAWVAGLFTGIFASITAGESITFLMRAAVTGRVSAISLLSALALPVLFSAFAVYISQPWLLIPIAFCKAFLFTYHSFGLLTAFGSAGWLIHLLFMFGDGLMLPFLWFCWLKLLSDNNQNAIYQIASVSAAAVTIACAEYRFISPFLANILS